jgi:cation transporter-like permease
MSTAPLGSRQAHVEATGRDKRARTFLLRLSVANWGIAVVAWTISAFLGITSPASIIVYTVLFVIGLFAVVVAIACFLLERFAHRPPELPAVGDPVQGGGQAAAPAGAPADSAS